MFSGPSSLSRLLRGHGRLPDHLGHVDEEHEVPADPLAPCTGRQPDQLAPAVRCEREQLLAHLEPVGYGDAQPARAQILRVPG